MSCLQDDLFIFGPGHVVRNALILLLYRFISHLGLIKPMQESGDNLAVQDLCVTACITYSVLKKPKLLRDLVLSWYGKLFSCGG